MATIFSSSFQFLKKERPYVLLVIFIVLFFGLALSKSEFRNSEESIMTEEMKQMDQVMEENIKNPEFLKEQFRKNPLLGLLTEIFTGFGLAALGFGIFLNIRMIQKTRFGESWLYERGGSINGDWGIASIARVVILFLFYSIILNFLLVHLKPFFPETLQTNFLLILHTTLTDILILIFIFHFVHKFTGFKLEGLGINGTLKWWSEIGTGLKSYIAILPSFLAVMVILITVSALFSYEPPPHPLIFVFLEEEKRAPWLVGYSVAVACLLGPIVEEIFFRGFVYGAIRKKWGIGWATILTSAFFAYVHNNWFAFLPIFLLSCVLCYLYEKRKNLIPSIALHVTHNSVFIFYFLLLKRLLIPEES